MNAIDSSTGRDREVNAGASAKPLQWEHPPGFKRSFLLLGFAALLIAFLGLMIRKLLFPATSISQIRSIAVLPLEERSSVPNQGYFADGIAQTLTKELGLIRSLRVISWTSANVYKATKKQPREVGRELRVDAIVEGFIERSQNQVYTSVQLIDTRNERVIWDHSYERDMASVLQLQADIARAIADQIGVELTASEKARFNRIHRDDPDSVDLYLEGIRRMNAGDPQSALDIFRSALGKDPYNVAAHAALADAYEWMGQAGWMSYKEAFTQEKAEALKAIGLDDSRAGPHLALGNSAMNQDWDWGTAKKEFLRALALEPNSVDVHRDYAAYVERIGLTKQAMEEGKIALRLDPLSSRTHMALAFHYYFDRQYDLALDQTQLASQLGGSPQEMLFPLGDVYVEKGMYYEGIHQFERLGDVPHALGHMGNAYARQGDTVEALKTIDKLERHVEFSGIGRYEIALIYAGLSQNDKAFEWLGKAYQSRDKGVTYILIDPCVDPIRNDPRFADLEKRIGFPL